APSGRYVTVTDRMHDVHLSVPEEYTEDVSVKSQDLRRWSGHGVTLEYRVVAGADVTAALARRSQVRGEIAGPPTAELPESRSGTDGRYLLSGALTSGGYTYER